MKIKRWLSRGIVLAMIVALMVPMPVAAAKSSGGGKLVKSVEYYNINSAGKWQLDSKTSFTYDKKKNPTEFKDTNYYSYWFGVPVSGGSSVRTAKYKYKGSTPKSMVLKDDAGFVVSKRTYKKGKLVKSVWDDKTARENKDGTVDSSISTGTTFVSYNKNGLASATSYQYSEATASGTTGTTDAYSWNTAYAYMEKKGIPSLVITTASYQDKDGNGEPSSEYTKFNDKGLAIETGQYDSSTGKYTPEYTIAYTMKKGNVKEAYVYSTDEKGNLTPTAMIRFNYAKTKISKARYMNMINSLLEGYDADEGYWYNPINGFFSWY